MAAFGTLLDTAGTPACDRIWAHRPLMREDVAAGHGQHDVSNLVQALTVQPEITGQPIATADGEPADDAVRDR